MYGCIKIVSQFYSSSIIALLMQIIVGMIVFVVLTVVYALKYNTELKELLLNALKSKRGK